MTSKERMKLALACGKPDMVPVCPGLSEGVPIRRSGLNYIEFFLKSKLPLWKARIETSVGFFGADGYVHIGWQSGPHDPPVEQVIRKETDDEVIFDVITHTAAGDLVQATSVGRDHTISIVKGAVSHPEADKAKVLCLIEHPDEADFSMYREGYEWVGDRAMVGLWISTPFEWWAQLRGGPEAAIMDAADFPEILDDIFAEYTRAMCALLERGLSSVTVDNVGLGGSVTSMSVINPNLHRRYSLPFGKAIVAVCRRHGVATQYHMCGRCRAALPITAEMGISGFDALECPPTGDVDLAEVKRTFGAGISIKGNVNSITVMLRGTPADVERDVERCMAAAKGGGGYVCSVGDQCPPETPDENIFALVEAARRLGRY